MIEVTDAGKEIYKNGASAGFAKTDESAVPPLKVVTTSGTELLAASGNKPGLRVSYIVHGRGW
jgi:hypothetical protein